METSNTEEKVILFYVLIFTSGPKLLLWILETRADHCGRQNHLLPHILCFHTLGLLQV